jgi:hypothetical protein
MAGVLQTASCETKRDVLRINKHKTMGEFAAILFNNSSSDKFRQLILTAKRKITLMKSHNVVQN